MKGRAAVDQENMVSLIRGELCLLDSQQPFSCSQCFSTQALCGKALLFFTSIKNSRTQLRLTVLSTVIEGEKENNDGNKNEFTGRNIVVSDFEVAPYDPDEYEYNGDQKCHGQIIVNKLEKTITFRHISGTKPIFNVVLAVMALNKNWFRVFKAEECESKYENNMLLIRDWPAAYYVAHMGGNGLPVVDQIIDHVLYFKDVEEFTLTELEFFCSLNSKVCFAFRLAVLNETGKDSLNTGNSGI